MTFHLNIVCIKRWLSIFDMTLFANVCKTMKFEAALLLSTCHLDSDGFVIVIVIVIVRMPHICGMDTYGMKIMPQMSGIATFQDIYGMLIFEDEHAIDV